MQELFIAELFTVAEKPWNGGSYPASFVPGLCLAGP
jgi:hypothetical protein